MPTSPDAPAIFSVTELTQNIKAHLETAFTRVWVSGEVSNFVHHTSGHMYFSIKDSGAQLSAVMFRGQNRRLMFRPANGIQVLALGNISVYPPRGQYQLVVEQLQPAGTGDLYQAFEVLKQKLAAEGLFDAIYKKPLPRFPTRIGVITSATGAAIRDMIQVITRRFPLAEILLYNAKVQGTGAGETIAAGIRHFNQEKACDVLIVGRGGGSIEDLWPFNEEVVARAIFDSRIPMISAVGHEIDTTISDLVADERAPTPSAAAELVVPDQSVIRQAHLEKSRVLPRILQKRLTHVRSRVEGLTRSYALRRPQILIQSRQQYLDQINDGLQRALQRRVESVGQRLDHLTEKLGLLNPMEVLGRGYAIVQRDDRQIIRSTEQIKPKQTVHVTLQHGTFDAKVETIHDTEQKA
ncbi:MAG: exodeoxyribonuclease VII large subunit [Lentisphaeria bacterium]|nr:exodeoxyribonuclease VII large subunit [Candidatus Neomarinimicrobiota bacterium]MCF7841497.1 exodeoxyribonuclease VII large subunit [Lentisphaeria bacterium]